MARESKLLFALWLVVAFLGGPTAGMNSSTATPTTAVVNSSTATPTTAVVNSSTATPTTAVVNSSTATSTTAVVNSSTATPTTAVVNSSTATPTTAVVNSSTVTSTTAVVNSSTATPTTAVVNSSTATSTTAVVNSSTVTSTTAVVNSSTATSTTAVVNSSTATPTTAGGITPNVTPTIEGGSSPSVTPVTPGGPPTTLTPATTTTSVPSTTKLPGPCDEKPCRDSSICEPRTNRTYVCLCLAGDDYNYESKRCVSAKVFPGQLRLPDLSYTDSMSDKTSPAFLEASLKITEPLNKAFITSGGSSKVVELSRLSESSKYSKFGSRSKEGGVKATVDIIFKADVDINTEEVKDILNNASVDCNCLLTNATFTSTSLCDEIPCDQMTTRCSADGDFNCTCLENYIPTKLSNRICIACPSGQKADNTKTCVPCPFGYSGLNCNESWKLVLVIVGSVLGGMLLITLILLPVVALKSSKKGSKKDKHADMGKPYASPPPAKQPLVNSNFAKSQPASFNGPTNGLSAFAGVPRMPRATATNSWDSRTNLEMNLSNSRQNLVPVGKNSRYYDDHDDMNQNAQVRPQSNPYAQARPQNNPYAQTNPYTQSQGNSNPYYTHDNGRQFN